MPLPLWFRLRAARSGRDASSFSDHQAKRQFELRSFPNAETVPSGTDRLRPSSKISIGISREDTMIVLLVLFLMGGWGVGTYWLVREVARPGRY